MSSFTGFNAPLNIVFKQPAPGSKVKTLWYVKAGFEYYLETDPNLLVRVPEGFVTDGASVPNVFWSLLPPWGEYGQASVLHDYLIDVGHIVTREGKVVRRADRHEARRHFRHALKVLKVPRYKRWLLIGGVFIWDVIKRNKVD